MPFLRYPLFIALALGWWNVAIAQPALEISRKTYFTTRTPAPPVIDGSLADSVWQLVPWGDGFTQRRPFDGAEPTHPTVFKILYDDHALYVAIRSFDPEPEKITSRMSRRDGFAGDLVEFNIDSYNDKRSAFSFTPSVSGVKGDEYVTEDGNHWDPSWDPVWRLKTRIDSAGWTAEAAIPLSQLRFSKQEEQVWGLQVMRHDFRAESRSVWQYLPANAGYYVSGFGELRGIRGIQPKRQVEIQPYVLAQLDRYRAQPEHPFADGSDASISAGLDGKIGVTNDLSVDFTINPDFGQVEADPSVINLDGFQIFFSERRPFFIQNRNLFNFNISNSEAGGSYDSDNLFYSRRIGASPHRFVFDNPELGSYVDQPEATSILGAVKFSGKTRSGLSVGILEGVTRKEFARVQQNGTIEKEPVEPFSSYFVGRVRQDFNEGNTIIGGVLTLVHRDIEDPELEFLHRSASSGGFDFIHRWRNRTWQVNARMVFSHVNGSTESIQRTQRSFEHGFTRPDAKHLTFDPDATSLTGQGGNVSLGRFGHNFMFQSGVTWRSPELELNDIGFLRNADEINYYHWMGYHRNTAYSIFRNTRLNYNHWARWDFGGRNLYRAVNMNAHAEFMSFWRAGAGGTYENLDISNTWLRGGPAYRRSSGMGMWTYVSSDTRKNISLLAEGSGGFGFDYRVRGADIFLLMRVQPSDAINFSIGPSWGKRERIDQYITTRQWQDKTRYITGHIHQSTLSFTLRLNYNITPDLTVQYYGQPFISRGYYSSINYVADPHTSDKTKGLFVFTDHQISRTSDGGYQIDEDGDSQTDYTFHNPDFNFVQFRSNLVMRWEYIPGSEIFLVWTQGNTAVSTPNENSLFRNLTDEVFGENTRNTFLLKFTYRFINK